MLQSGNKGDMRGVINKFVDKCYNLNTIKVKQNVHNMLILDYFVTCMKNGMLFWLAVRQ